MVAYVERGPELIKALREAGADMKDLRAANLAAAKIVERAARVIVPRRSGKLAAALKAGATQKYGYIRYGKKTVPYAAPIQWGWPARNIESNDYTIRAAQQTEGLWVAEYHRHVSKILDKVGSAT